MTWLLNGTDQGMRFLERILEPEVMDGLEEALAYDRMDHSEVNRLFVEHLQAWWEANPSPLSSLKEDSPILDVGCGTGLIPIEAARQLPGVKITGVDLAESMLAIGREHLRKTGLIDRVELIHCDAKKLPFQDETFFAVVSNSIIHHIPAPLACLREMVRVCKKGGTLFVRDLFRPESMDELNRLVSLHAANADAQQRHLFAASLHAALTLAEIRQGVAELGFDPQSVMQTSDRHWTWAARKPG